MEAPTLSQYCSRTPASRQRHHTPSSSFVCQCLPMYLTVLYWLALKLRFLKPLNGTLCCLLSDFIHYILHWLIFTHDFYENWFTNGLSETHLFRMWGQMPGTCLPPHLRILDQTSGGQGPNRGVGVCGTQRQPCPKGAHANIVTIMREEPHKLVVPQCQQRHDLDRTSDGMSIWRCRTIWIRIHTFATLIAAIHNIHAYRLVNICHDHK